MPYMMEFPFDIFRPLAAVQHVNHVNTPTIPSGSSSFHTCTGIIIMMFLSVDALSILIHESNSLKVWSGQCCCCSDIRDVFAGTYSQPMSQTKTKLCKGPSIKFNVASKRKFMTHLLQTPPPPSKRKPTVR